MRLAVSSKKLTDPRQITDYARKRALFALDRFTHAVEQVRVTIEDINGPRGGVDKRCVVDVQGHKLGRVLVETTDVDARVAVDAGVDRAARAVVRALQRRRTHTRSSLMGLATDLASTA